MPAAQPHATVIAIQTASTAAMIAPHLHTALGSLSPARALGQSNRTHPGSVNPIGCAKTAICRPDRLYAPNTHRALNLTPPTPTAAHVHGIPPTPASIERRDRLSGLIHEYNLAA
jgi:hypothetical protein